MLRSTVAVTLILFVATRVETARAEGLIFNLPDDGSWAHFEQVQVKSLVDSNSGKILIKDRTTRTTLRVASVGQATVDKKSCRWIEYKLGGTGDKSVKTLIVKVLIPEEHLKKGGDPARNIMHGWVKNEDSPVVPLKDDAIPVQMLVAGPDKEITKLDAKIVECKVGKLKCEGLTGTREWKDRNERVFNTTHELRLHKKSPFGVAWWKSENDVVDRGARMTITMTSSLIESGSDATSDLPDHN